MHERTANLKDRHAAGVQLGERLRHLQPASPLVLALPRGGVPVGFEIARRLAAPLDVLIVRKIGAPDSPEYGLGAMVEDGAYSLDDDRVREGGYSSSQLKPVIERERKETERRTRVYRSVRPWIERRGRTVIVVDDGAATGGSLLMALRSVRSQGARRVVAALGVAPPDTCLRLERETDELVVLYRPTNFYAVGQFYDHFDPVEDAEVLELLRRSATPPSP